MKTVFSCVLLCLFASSSLATSRQVIKDYRKLRYVPAKYSVFGTVCEEVARLRLRNSYPASKFKIEVGIVYRLGGRTLGELDVVVFRRSDNEAVLVGEVKCRKSLPRALDKAKKQLKRFEGYVGDEDVRLSSVRDSRKSFRIDQFDESPEFRTISQDGGEAAGFDMEIGLDLKEAYDLQELLVWCQRQRRCPELLNSSG